MRKARTKLTTTSPCQHPTVINDMCADCGSDLTKTTTPPSASVSMVHSLPGLKVSMETAQLIHKTEEDRLLRDEKLVLLVDLDQTLIHTTNEAVSLLEGVFHFQLCHGNNVWYHTKLRPLTERFLRNIAPLFELHIFTFGTRSYATAIAGHLDPDKGLFSDRILSRDECFSPLTKTANLKELFPRGDHMVCIIDDREDVWNFAHNLIHVKPYHFWRHTGDINAPELSMDNKGVAVDGVEDSSPQEDDYLLHLEGILRQIHSAYFSLYNEKKIVPDLKNVIPYCRKKVLRKTQIVFSGLIPTETPPELKIRSRPYKTALSLGATISETIVPKNTTEPPTTHLIAARPGTAKVNEARRHGIEIVGPEWLYACAERWEKCEEKLFPVGKNVIEKKPPPQSSSSKEKKTPFDYNPLLSFSADEIESMGHEVDDVIDDDDDDDDEDEEDSEEEEEPPTKKDKNDEEWMANQIQCFLDE